MSLLENIQRIGGGLLDFANGLPGVLAPSMSDPAGDPSLASAADPAAVAAARERYKRAYVAQMMQAAQSGTPLAALDATAATNAQPSYDNDISRAVQAAQYLKQQREQTKRTESLQQLISSVTDPKQKAALSIATPDQASAQMLKEAFPVEKSGLERYVIQPIGNGYAVMLDRQTGQKEMIKAPADATAASGTPQLDPETANRIAVEYMTDKTALQRHLPGKWNAANRQLVEQQINANMKAAGLRPSDVTSIQANATAQTASIKTMQGQLNAISSFENLARFNGQRLLDLVDRVDDTNVPAIEGYARAFARKGGAVDPAEFASVLVAFQNEAARILTTPDAKGIVTDSARHEVMDIAPKDMTAAQAKRIINRLFLEMDARKSYLSQQIASAYQTMQPGGFNPAGTQAPAAVPPTQPVTGTGAASVPGGLDTVPAPYTFPTLPRK